ncbi:hypothetical protein ACHAXT_000697 [Thalassiosira profunda]
MASCVAVLAWALVLAAVGRGWGRRIDVNPSVVARGTSSWNHRPATASQDAGGGGHRRHRAAFISNAPSAVTRHEETSRRRLAFLSSLMQTRTHPASNKHSYQLCMAAEDDTKSSDEVDEECSLQKLYQEVQEEDSEWYYRTFAKLLDEDEPEVCEGGASPEGVESAESDDGDGEKASGAAGEKEEGIVSKGAPEMLQKVEHPDEQLQQAKAEGSKALDGGESIEAEATSEEKTTPAGAEKETPEMQQSQQPSAREDTSKAERRTPSPSERAVDEGRHSTRRDDQQYEDEEGGEELDDVPTPRPQRSQPSEKAQPQAASSSPKIVRLRNTYTNEVEPLGSLAQLAKLGYSERELVVLRPQVLELIAEDGIPRPDKGLPKRWVRLSRLDGYGGEVEDEDDEDADWEVEVVSREASVNKMKEQAMRGPRASQGEAGDEQPPEKPESAARKDETESQQREQPPLRENLEEVDEEGSSERVSSEERYDRTATDDNDRARDRLRRPSRAKQSDVSDSPDRRYAEGRGDEDARRPAQRRRQREYDEYDDSPPRRPQRSPRDEQPRRQRSRSDGQSRRRRRPSERELLVDRGSYSDGAEPPGNQFWMNLPTFRDYLRKEAQLRLQILGPDWKESVLDESRWRYDLYKTWLTMLDEGVGENLLDDYVDRPARPSERRRTPRSRSERDYEEPSPRPQRPQRRRPERDLGDDIDEEDYGRQNRRSRSGEQRRRRSSSDYDSRPPPPRQNRSKWKNFNDLEESLQRTQRERRRPQIDYEDDRSYEPPMDKEDDLYPDEEREYAPRQRRRRPSERKRRAYVEPEDEEEEEYGEQSRQSRQGRSRQYSARHEEENFDEPLEEEEADDDTSQPKRRDLR